MIKNEDIDKSIDKQLISPNDPDIDLKGTQIFTL